MGARANVRSCPRCDRELNARERQGEGGAMLVWQCACGWAGARTVPVGEDAGRKRAISGVTARVHIELEDREQRRRS